MYLLHNGTAVSFHSINFVQYSTYQLHIGAVTEQMSSVSVWAHVEDIFLGMKFKRMKYFCVC